MQITAKAQNILEVKPRAKLEHVSWFYTGNTKAKLPGRAAGGSLEDAFGHGSNRGPVLWFACGLAALRWAEYSQA